MTVESDKKINYTFVLLLTGKGKQLRTLLLRDLSEIVEVETVSRGFIVVTVV